MNARGCGDRAAPCGCGRFDDEPGTVYLRVLPLGCSRRGLEPEIAAALGEVVFAG